MSSAAVVIGTLRGKTTWLNSNEKRQCVQNIFFDARGYFARYQRNWLTSVMHHRISGKAIIQFIVNYMVVYQECEYTPKDFKLVFVILRKMGILSGEATFIFHFCPPPPPPYLDGSTLKEKNLLP